MRVLMLSKACIVGQYQSKLEALAQQPGLDLTVVVPPFWRDERGTVELERLHTSGYKLLVAPIRFNGRYHLHYYPTINEILIRARADIVHIDEEPYNLATFHAARTASRVSPASRLIFFTWQNLLRRYPPPFNLMEQYSYRSADAAIAGSEQARTVLRSKGFKRPIRVIPQFGVAAAYTPLVRADKSAGPLIVGFAGRLVEEKGTALLLRALAPIQKDWELRILGDGPLRQSLTSMADSLGIRARVRFDPSIPSREMPAYFNSLDLFVLPSLSRPNWKEQFGRVLTEAMASGIPVIGSDSGEIPNVIGEAGLIFHEGSVQDLTKALTALMDNPSLRAELGLKGRARALELFSQEQVVKKTVALYTELMAN